MSTVGDESANEEEALVDTQEEQENEEENNSVQPTKFTMDIIVVTPSGAKVFIPSATVTEPISFLRFVLQEFQETAAFTNYEFEMDGMLINDYAEICQYVAPDDDREALVLTMKPMQYDIKKARGQLKRVRDMIAYPPLTKGSIPDTTEIATSATTGAATEKEDSDTTYQKTKDCAPYVIKVLRERLPKADEIFAEAKLQDFFAQSMLRAGTPNPTILFKTPIKLPSECVRSLSASGWNPPPLSRRSQGDLFYIEAVTEEGVIHITCCPSGFYVNRSTRLIFDPLHAVNAHFSHELYSTLLGASASLRNTWHVHRTEEAVSKASTNLDYNPYALEVVSTLYSQGREDQIFQKPQWTVPYAGSTGIGSSHGEPESVIKGVKHTYDLSRLHDDLGDHFGAEEPGAPREWNEEMQSIRALETKEVSEKVMKAKFIHKFYTEFADAVKAGALAISEGHIAPINPMDEEKTQVYVYNNIFYSRAVDTKENFKVCQGDDANRKLSSHDIKNQKLIQTVGIEGLCTVLSCVVDYKGDRIVGQTIIPGVLQTGIHSARLLYGVLEAGKRMTVKTEGLALMEALCSKLYIAKRTITATPSVTIYGGDEAADLEEAEKAKARNAVVNDIPMLGLFGGLDDSQEPPAGVLVDLEDEVMPADSETVPHAGCIEIKILKGTDGRCYTLEAMRLTPRDANYVKNAKGTGNVSAEKIADLDDNMAMTYVLRHELVHMYAQHKFAMMRQELLQEEITRQRGLGSKKATPATATGAESEAVPLPVGDAAVKKDDTSADQANGADPGPFSPVADTPDFCRSVASPATTPSEPANPATTVKSLQPTALSESFSEQETESNIAANSAIVAQENLTESEVKKNLAADNEKYAKDLNAKLLAISADNLGIVLNANCFIDGFECDVDPVVALKDEETARMMADFLYKQGLSAITEQVRCADFIPLDSEALVELLHAHGINMRYLGRLAELAHEQENQDRELLLNSRQKIQSMPYYWLEMLEIEVLSRCFKHHLNNTFRDHPEIKLCPAATIATLLNHVFGSAVSSNAVVPSVAHVEVEDTHKAAIDKKKKKRGKGSAEHSEVRHKEEIPSTTAVPECANAGGVKEECIQRLHSLAKSRFCMPVFALMFPTPAPVPVPTPAETGDASTSASAPAPAAATAPATATVPAVDSVPVSQPFLSDRISRITLLRRICQVTGLRIIARNYDFEGSSPFKTEDIVGLTPLMKTCEQAVPMAELREVMTTARTYLNEGNFPAAFDLAHQASSHVQMITGSVHKEAALSMDLVSSVLIEAGDHMPALNSVCKSLSIAVQLGGLDNQHTLQLHSKIAALLVDTANPLSAVQHLLAAKYLIELMGGPRHPELVTVYFRLVGIYDELGEFETAQLCLETAKHLSPNVAKQCMISATIAELHDRMGNLSEALSEQKNVLKVMEQLFGVEDEKTIEAKTRVEHFLRKVTVENLNSARELLALKEQEKPPKKGSISIISEKCLMREFENGNNLDQVIEKIAIEAASAKKGKKIKKSKKVKK